MTNNKTIAVSILSNIVSSVFNISPNEVRISNYQLTPETQFIYLTPDIMSYNKTIFEEHKFWGFSPELGFVIVQEIVGNESFLNGNHDHSFDEGCKLHEIENVDKYIFFLHYEKGCTQWDDEYENWTLYKSPNFKEYWEKN